MTVASLGLYCARMDFVKVPKVLITALLYHQLNVKQRRRGSFHLQSDPSFFLWYTGMGSFIHTGPGIIRWAASEIANTYSKCRLKAHGFHRGMKDDVAALDPLVGIHSNNDSESNFGLRSLAYG